MTTESRRNWYTAYRTMRLVVNNPKRYMADSAHISDGISIAGVQRMVWTLNPYHPTVYEVWGKYAQEVMRTLWQLGYIAYAREEWNATHTERIRVLPRPSHVHRKDLVDQLCK